MEHPLQQDALEPDQIHTAQDSAAALNRTLRFTLIGCGVLILILCALCAILSLTGTVVITEVWNQFSREFDDQFSQYSGDLAEYEDSLRDLSGTDDRELEIFAGDGWPADIPDDIPQFSAGTFTDSEVAGTSEGGIWVLSFSDVTAADVDNYRNELLALGWTDDGSAGTAGETLGDTYAVFSVTKDGSFITMIMFDGRADLTVNLAGGL
ncbi:MAG: hypothetical protein TR69_WS6001000945 [candidate division WS6 bacterium OLB20]|uniref:Uncharacterized protein n=1 Tax=candidate division WS6 bacterium OLB20 TaxID=1617426 RepID=A0A136LZ48_9BACT|nr:MAG: hypothetical protein TR69_WS6001000945 [candidate division WS6 bacterium OLB20]